MKIIDFARKGNVVGIYIEEWSNIVETEDVVHGLTDK